MERLGLLRLLQHPDQGHDMIALLAVFFSDYGALLFCPIIIDSDSMVGFYDRILVTSKRPKHLILAFNGY